MKKALANALEAMMKANQSGTSFKREDFVKAMREAAAEPKVPVLTVSVHNSVSRESQTSQGSLVLAFVQEPKAVNPAKGDPLFKTQMVFAGAAGPEEIIAMMEAIQEAADFLVEKLVEKTLEVAEESSGIMFAKLSDILH